MIPSFRVEFTDEEIEATLSDCEQVLRSGRLTLGPYTEQFEAVMAGVAGTKYSVAVNSGSTALEIIFRSLDLRGRHVLVPTNTNFATAAAAIYAGARVGIYDSGLYPNLEDIERRLTPDTAAIVVVHIGGYISPDLPRLADMCARSDIALIEDAAHAHGAMLDGRPAGSFGRAAAFSFFPTKVVTTGEGGLIATEDMRLAEQARQFRDQGKAADGVHHVLPGNSWRLTELGAALGLAQLARFSDDAKRRSDVIERYRALLIGVPGISFPNEVTASRPSGYKAIAMLAEEVDRAALKAALVSKGVQLGKEVYEVPLHQQPVFQNLKPSGSYETADSFCASHICLPLWRYIDDADVGIVSEVLRSELPSLLRQE